MPEETIAPTPDFSIERNNISKDFFKSITKKGKSPGVVYFKPEEVTEANLEETKDWIGVSGVVDIIGSFLNKICLGLAKEATSEDGVLNLDELKKNLAKLSAAGLRKAELIAESFRLQAQLFVLQDRNAPREEIMSLIDRMRANKVALDSKTKKDDAEETEE